MSIEPKIDLNKACQLASNYFKNKEPKCLGIGFCNDAGDIWIIGQDFGQVMFGPQPISVNKTTGEIEMFHIPTNIEVFGSSIELQVPEKFRKF